MDNKQFQANSSQRLYARILQVMENEKPYLNARLTLHNLASLVGTNRTQLSITLNQQTGTNFCRWLSTYRVNYLVKEYNLHPELNTLQLCLKAGFPSRTSFYRQFKEVTGKTPNEFFSER